MHYRFAQPTRRCDDYAQRSETSWRPSAAKALHFACKRDPEGLQFAAELTCRACRLRLRCFFLYGGQGMDPQHTALVLIGYQNDYFATDGVLYRVIEEASRVTGTL